MRAGLMILLVTSACRTRGTTPTTPLHPVTGSSHLVVLMLNMTNLALEWQFFNAQSDSIDAGTITAGSASWCAKIPIPAAAETARLFGRFIERGYVYKGARPVYWCIHDQTALAELKQMALTGESEDNRMMAVIALRRANTTASQAALQEVAQQSTDPTVSQSILGKPQDPAPK